MLGAFVHNAFLYGEKHAEPLAMFRRSAEAAGIDLVAATNADLAVPIGDRGAVEDVIGDADFVLFWDKDVACAENLEACGFRVFNSSDCIRVCDDKALTHLALSRAGVRSIPTVACPLSFSDYGPTAFADRAEGLLGYPMVVKDRFGSFGEQVRLARDRPSLEGELSGPYVPRILQRYVECGGRDVRVEVVGGRAVAAMSRRAPEGDFRSNATIGGSIAAHEPSAEEAEIAVRAAEAVGADFAGVDVLSMDGSSAVIEVNSSAHLRNLLDCTGVDASRIVLEHIAGTVRG